MRSNPIFREGVELYLIEGHGFVVYGYFLMILAVLEFLILFLPSIDPQAWVGPSNLFKLSAAAALLLIVYSVLRIANQEFVPWRFIALRRWFDGEGLSMWDVAKGQIALLCLHVFLFVLLSAPLLIWAGAITRAPAGSVLFTFSVLFFYSLSYGVWALPAVTVWERRVESRQVFIRCLFISLVLLSALFYAPVNPVAFLLYYLGGKEMAPLVFWGWKWPAASVHFLFHLLLLGSGLLLYAAALRKREGKR